MSWIIAAASQFLLFTLVFHGRASASAQCVAPPAGLLSWWTGDVDESDLYGVNNPSAVNAVTLVPGKVLDGFTFGTGGYVDIPASSTLANQKFTWDAWVEPEGPGPNNDDTGSVIVQLGNDNDQEYVSVSLAWRATVYVQTERGAIVGGSGVLEGSYAETKSIAYITAAGTRLATMNVSDSANDSPQTVGLGGIGTQISPAQISAGTTGGIGPR